MKKLISTVLSMSIILSACNINAFAEITPYESNKMSNCKVYNGEKLTNEWDNILFNINEKNILFNNIKANSKAEVRKDIVNIIIDSTCIATISISGTVTIFKGCYKIINRLISRLVSKLIKDRKNEKCNTKYNIDNITIVSAILATLIPTILNYKFFKVICEKTDINILAWNTEDYLIRAWNEYLNHKNDEEQYAFLSKENGKFVIK